MLQFVDFTAGCDKCTDFIKQIVSILLWLLSFGIFVKPRKTYEILVVAL